MQAGRLDRRVTLRRPVMRPDAMNQPIPSWAEVGPVAASRRDVSDAQRVAAEQVGGTFTCWFQVRRQRAVEDLDATWQLVSDGLTFAIISKKELLANGLFGRVVGFELAARALADTPAPPDDGATG